MRGILVFALVLAGCGNEEPEEAREEHAEGHVHKAPHGGALHEIGDHFANVELLFDSKQGRLTLFVLGSHAETAVRIKQESLAIEIEIPEKVQAENIQMALRARADPLSGETEGDSSVFTGASDRLKGLERFLVEIKEIEIRGERYSGLWLKYPEGD